MFNNHLTRLLALIVGMEQAWAILGSLEYRQGRKYRKAVGK